MKQIIGSKIVFLLLLFFAIISPGTSKYLTPAALAGDGSKIHWVSPTGTAAWSDCENSTDPGPGKYCKLGYGSNGLNDQVRAGDTVYLKGGTYLWTPTTWYGAINPNHSGTQPQRILISAAPGETPVIEAANDDNDGYMYAISFGIGPSVDTPINYTRITGITFRNMPRMAYIRNSSSYNEIDHCTFENTKLGKYGIILTGMCAGGGSVTCYVTHNWIHDNTLIRANVSGCAEIGAYADLIRVGDDGGAWDGTGENNYNTIENNVLSYASHSVMDVFGRFNVIKNNTAHNEPFADCSTPSWSLQWLDSNLNGKASHRGIQTNDDFFRSPPNDKVYDLVEGNRLGYSGMPGTGNTSDGGLVIGGNGNIVRYNSVYGGAKMGLYFKYVNRNSKNQGGYGGRDARAYNNTIWNNGYFYIGNADIIPYRVNVMVMQYCGNSVDHTGIVLKNNILYQAADGDWDWGLCAACDCTNVPYTGPCSKMSDCVAIEQNWCTRAADGCARNGDPKFNNPVKVGDSGWSSLYYFSTSLPDLSLQPSSGAIDGGTYLTQARGGGSTSTNLIVDDALYFQDGSWGSALARGVTLFPDWIAIGTVTNTVQIAQGGINYSTNTITLASPMTWTNGAPIWLFKKSDGTKVLYGSAPDYGAYEYLPSGDTIPPAAPTGLVVN